MDRTKTPIVKRTDRFLVALAKSGNLTLACRAGGLTRRDVETLRSQRPDFDVAFKDALEEAADILEAEAWRRALEGVAQPVIKAGQLVLDPDTEKPLMVRRYSDALLMLLLRSNKPAKFQRSSAVFPQDDTAQIIKEIAADEDPPRHECDAALANQYKN